MLPWDRAGARRQTLKVPMGRMCSECSCSTQWLNDLGTERRRHSHYQHLEARTVLGRSVVRVRLFVTPWTVARQPPLSMGFSKQEYWREVPFPPPGDLPTQGSNWGLLHCRWTIYHLIHQGSPERSTGAGKDLLDWYCFSPPGLIVD